VQSRTDGYQRLNSDFIRSRLSWLIGVERDLLGADRRALADVGAAAEALVVVLGDHRLAPALYRSGWPCGSIARWVIFADVNSMPDPLGQAATQAPQPMQVAASNARSASSFGAGTECASGADPALTRDEAAGLDDPVERGAVDDQVLDDREGPRAPRLDVDRGPIGERPHVQLARGGRDRGSATVGGTVDDDATHATDALAAVVVERHRLLALDGEVLVEQVEHLEEGHVFGDALHPVLTILPGCLGVRPDARLAG
jgi:hypothetical protein